MTTTTNHSARIAILAAQFNKPLVDGMVAAARAEAAARNAKVLHEARVPGCYEVPLVASRLLARGDVDALVVLGYIERGETMHGEIMGHVVHRTLIDLQLRLGKPVGLGIIGPGATAEQAEARRDSYAKSAVAAALSVHAVIEKIR